MMLNRHKNRSLRHIRQFEEFTNLLVLIIFSAQFIKKSDYKKIGYNINVLQHTACSLLHLVPLGCLQFVIVVFPDHAHLLVLVVNPITIGNFAFLFN